MYVLIPVFLLGMGSPGYAPHVAAATSSTASAGLFIPLYTYPGSSWTYAEQVKQSNPGVPMTVIVNPADGPGSRYDSNYGSGIEQMRGDGINVIGYVYTDYASRSVSAAETDIATYAQLYDVNGIFLDEMSNVAGHESYYSTLTAYAHSLGLSLVVGNPGTSVPQSYLGTVDVIVIYENSGIPSQSVLSSYTAGGDPSEFAVISYGVQQPSQSQASLLEDYVSNIFITNGTMPDPYHALPPYLSDLASYLSLPSLAPVPTSESATVPIVVQSIDLNGDPIVGMWTTITSSTGTLLATGYTPLTFTVSTGSTYVVSVANYQNIIFNHWQSGSATPSISVTATQATTLTASYSTAPPSITVSSMTSSGSSFGGMWTVVYNQQGSVLQTGFTPLTYTGIAGSTYTVCMGSYENYIFSNWQNTGSSNSCQTVSLTQNTQLVTVYNT
jgi:Spherulation-specific family 4